MEVKKTKVFWRVLRQCVSLVISISIVVGISSSIVMSASADSSNRIAAFIQLAADGAVTDANVEEVTESELRFLGLYLSNFYVPFGTELGTAANGDLEDETKADMIDTLQTKLAFSDVLAEEIVEVVYGYMRSSMQDLEIMVSAEWQDGDYKPLSCVAPNYWNFLRLMSGRSDDVFYKYYYGFDSTDISKGKVETQKDTIATYLTEVAKEASGGKVKGKLTYKELNATLKSDVDVLYDIYVGNYKYLYFGYNGSNGFTPVFDCSIQSKDEKCPFYTPSQVAFLKCLESCDIEKGYGFSYADFSTIDGVDEESFKKLVNETSASDIVKMSMWGTNMSVDCFGDIIAMGGNHQMIIVPGCMNPYSWRGVDFYGNDSKDLKPGSAYNFINSLSMIEIENVGASNNMMIGSFVAKGVSNVYASGERKSSDTDTSTDAEGSSDTDSDSASSSGSSEVVSNPDTPARSGAGYENTSFELEKKTPEKSGELEGRHSRFEESRKQVSERLANKESNISNGSSSSDKDKSNSSKNSSDKDSDKSSDKDTDTTRRTKSHKKYGVNIDDTDIEDVFAISNTTLDITNIVDGNGRSVFMPNFEVLKDKVDDLLVKWSITKTVSDGCTPMLSMPIFRGEAQKDWGLALWGDSIDKAERTFAMKAQEGFYSEHPYDRTWYYTSRGGCDSGMVGNGSIMGWFKGNESSELTISLEAALPGIGRDSTDYMLEMAVRHNSTTANLGCIAFNNVVFIDNLGAYSDPELEYNAFNVESFVDETGNVKDTMGDIEFRSGHNFGSLYTDIKEGRLEIPNKATEQALSTLYVTYCWACLYDESAKAGTIGRLGYRFNVEGFPPMGDNPIYLDQLSGLDDFDMQKAAIQNWLYYLLHPTDGMDYFKILFTNKINSFLLSKHADMVGTNGTMVTVGTTKYRSTMGYVTMPDLSEIEWTNQLIGFYNELIPVLIVILMVIMLFAFITGALNMQHSIAGLLLFAVFTFIPVNLINGLVEQSNRISQSIYGNKFTYWALVQQESYSKAIDTAANAPGSSGNSTYDNYLRTLYAENQQVYTNQGTESILVKWQAPKKMASLVLSESDAKSVNGLSTVGQKMLRGMLNNAYSGQSYVDDEEAVYMYRSYLDLSNFSRYVYNGIARSKKVTRSIDGSFGTTTSVVNKNGWTEMPIDMMTASEYSTYIQNGYSNQASADSVGRDTSVSTVTTSSTDTDTDILITSSSSDTDGSIITGTDDYSKQFYLTAPLSSNIINDVLTTDVTTFTTSSQNVPINADVFNFGIPMFTNDSMEFSVENFAATGGLGDGVRKQDLETYMSNYTAVEDYTGLAAFGLYSENPYYYFSWKLYSDGLDSSSSLMSSHYKQLLLGQANGGYFYNTKSNGEIKDIMNMRGLFTYIIPYMKQCNDIVRDFDDTFGIFIYDGVPTEEGRWADVEGDPELAAKYWHNLQVTRLYCLYCPWVDVMYDCSYAKPEMITVMGEKYMVQDPLNPKSYPDSRPMIFSESEMVDYGLSESDLTTVEKKILKCNKQYLERMYELLNYYNFSDVSLDSAAAINCAFVFNNTFSENGIFTDNHNIYPQSFDLSNFSFDAFLRFILSNATGEDLLKAEKLKGTVNGTTSGDFYERIVNNSSMVTALVMIVLDIISLYLLPSVRIFFLITIFLSAILMVLMSAFRIEDNMKFIKKVAVQFVLPLFYFFGSTVAFSLIVSLFMGKANNAVTQDVDYSISMGDPVVTMLLITALSVVLLIIYVMITINVVKDIKHSGKLISGFIGGIGSSVGGAISGAIGGAIAGTGAAVSGASSLVGKASRAIERRRNRKTAESSNEYLEQIADNTAQRGTGVESARAAERGSNAKAEDNEDLSLPLRDEREQKDLGDRNDASMSKEEMDRRMEELNAKAREASSQIVEGASSSEALRRDRDNNVSNSDFSDDEM